MSGMHSLTTSSSLSSSGTFSFGPAPRHSRDSLSSQAVVSRDALAHRLPRASGTSSFLGAQSALEPSEPRAAALPAGSLPHLGHPIPRQGDGGEGATLFSSSAQFGASFSSSLSMSAREPPEAASSSFHGAHSPPQQPPPSPAPLERPTAPARARASSTSGKGAARTSPKADEEDGFDYPPSACTSSPRSPFPPPLGNVRPKEPQTLSLTTHSPILSPCTWPCAGEPGPPSLASLFSKRGRQGPISPGLMGLLACFLLLLVISFAPSLFSSGPARLPSNSGSFPPSSSGSSALGGSGAVPVAIAVPVAVISVTSPSLPLPMSSMAAAFISSGAVSITSAAITSAAPASLIDPLKELLDFLEDPAHRGPGAC